MAAFYMDPLYSLGMTGLFILVFLMFFLTIMMTGHVTVPMLKARLLGRHLVAIVQKNKAIKLASGKYKAGVAITSDGPFVVRNEGTYSMGGATVSIAYEDYAVPLSEKEVVAANILKAEGYDEYNDLPVSIDLSDTDVDTKDYLPKERGGAN